ncbi:hypothetical protein [Streptomyces virginiae]|uniref:hypothetical protein n=1 Tax=Streptomyces virginiae TaxID=1961 RepID=UPI0036FED657
MAVAVGEMYSFAVEDAILVWSLVPVRLSYGYDLAALLDDLVPLLEETRRAGFSDAEVFCGSATFSAEWRIVREGDSLRVVARWYSTLGNYESLLAERGDVVAPVRELIGEWAKELRRIVTDIQSRGWAWRTTTSSVAPRLCSPPPEPTTGHHTRGGPAAHRIFRSDAAPT